MQPFFEDEQLTAYLEGERCEPMQGWPAYAGCAVLTANREIWWQPVTVAEMLDAYARQQQRTINEHVQRNRIELFDLAAAESKAEALRALDPRMADLGLLAARQCKAGEHEHHRKLQEARAVLQAALDKSRAARAAQRTSGNSQDAKVPSADC